METKIKIGDIALYRRDNGKQGIGVITYIDGVNVLLTNLHTTTLDKLSGQFGSGNRQIHIDRIIDTLKIEAV